MTSGGGSTGEREVPDGEAVGLNLFGDDALGGAEDDHLGRIDFASRFVALLESVSAQTPSAVVGLIGAWGSGKTSVLHLARQLLSNEEASAWEVVEFNPWIVADVASLTQEFLTTVGSALPEKSSARLQIARYTKRVAPLTSLASVIGLDPSKAMEALADQLTGDTSLEAQRRGLESSLVEANRRILVLIDDVDRLHGDELAALLKLVRLVGRLPNVFYVLAYDETTLLDVLGRTDIARDRPGRALSYLDKIVQLRLDLPPAPQVLLDRMANEATEHIVTSNELQLTREQRNRLKDAYQKHLRPVLVEPRHVKRYFGQVEAMYPLLGTEVDFVDFALVTFLRTFFPEAHRLLRHHQEELMGAEMTVGERPTPDDRITTWRARLTSAEVGLSAPEAESVLALLGELFPPLSRFGRSRRSESKPIGSPEYFDRYLYLALPPGDVSDAQVHAAVEEVLQVGVGERATDLLDLLQDAAAPIALKLRRARIETEADARALLPFASQVLATCPDDGLLGQATLVLRHWIVELLGQADLVNPDPLLDAMLVHLEIVELTRAYLSLWRERQEKGGTASAAQTNFEQALILRIEADLDAETARPPRELKRFIDRLLQWAQLADDATVRAWLRSKVGPDGEWPTDEFVGIFSGAFEIVGVPDPTPWAGDVMIDYLDRFIGIEYVLEQFEPKIDHGIQWSRRTPATWEERRRRVHHVLATKAAENPSEVAPIAEPAALRDAHAEDAARQGPA